MSTDLEDIPNWTFYDFPDHMISHRDSFINMVCESKSAYFYGEVRVTVVKLPDQNWWIVPYFNDEDHLMEDNVDECRARLLKIAGDTPENRAIVEWNIRQGDGTVFDYEVEFDRELKAARDQFEKDQNDLFGW